jgi:hypothetical protein
LLHLTSGGSGGKGGQGMVHPIKREILSPRGHTLLYSEAELLKVEIVKLHNCANFLRICAKFKLLGAKMVKQSLFL